LLIQNSWDMPEQLTCVTLLIKAWRAHQDTQLTLLFSCTTVRGWPQCRWEVFQQVWKNERNKFKDRRGKYGVVQFRQIM